MPARRVREGSGSPAVAREFIILRIGEKMEPGATCTFLASAPTLQAAMDAIEQLTDTSSTRLAILQTQQIIVRKPAMAVHVVGDGFAGASS